MTPDMPNVVGGLELMSVCAFGIIVLVGLVIATLTLAVYVKKQQDQEDEIIRHEPMRNEPPRG